MASTRDYYDILGISRSSDADEIKRAYRKLARELHPDMNKAADASEKFNEVQEAYDTLSDSEKKSSYDRFGHAGGGGAGVGGGVPLNLPIGGGGAGGGGPGGPGGAGGGGGFGF